MIEENKIDTTGKFNAELDKRITGFLIKRGLKSWLWRFVAPSRMRLANSITVLPTELGILLNKDFQKDLISTPHREVVVKNAVDKLLAWAQIAFDNNKTDIGWHCVQSANRISLFGMKDDNLKAIAHAIFNEGRDKLGSWRKDTIESILKNQQTEKIVLKDEIGPYELASAWQILQEHHSNTYQKLAVIRRQLTLLNICAVIVTIAIVYIAPRWARNIFGHHHLMASVSIFGVMGACFSGIFSVIKNGNRGRIPDLLLNHSITIARLVVGAMAALVIYTFLKAGMLKLEILTTNELPIILGISFVAGFSERLVEKAVEMVAAQPKS